MRRTTVNDEQGKRVSIPTDAQVVREFIAEAEAFRAKIESDDDRDAEGNDFNIWQGNMDARLALASRLEYVKAQREALVKEAAEKIAESFTEGLRRFADNLSKVVNGTKTDDADKA